MGAYVQREVFPTQIPAKRYARLYACQVSCYSGPNEIARCVLKLHGGSLDPLDYRILRELQEDARLSMRELGRRVDLSAPAVTERVRRLEETGVVLGYGARVASKPLGRSITAFVGVQDSGKRDPELVRWAQKHDGVLECHSVTGNNSCILKVAVPDVHALETLLGDLIGMGFTCETSIVLSTPLEGKLMLPPV